MENKIIFLLLAILLIFLLFSQGGIKVIKNLIGVATNSITPSTTPGTDASASLDTGMGTSPSTVAPDPSQTYSGGVSSDTISSGINNA